MSATLAEKFADEFLRHYLMNGMGSLSKSDVDALVMHLLDKYVHVNGMPLQQKSNQALSETLRTPLTKVKRLRYEAGLKFGGRVAEEAERRFLACLSCASLEVTSDKIVLIIEDALAKHWIQGKIIERGALFDGSFNPDIIKVKPEDFFKVLYAVLENNKDQVDKFKAQYDSELKELKNQQRSEAFKEIVKDFVSGTLGSLGVTAITTLLRLPG